MKLGEVASVVAGAVPGGMGVAKVTEDQEVA